MEKRFSNLTLKDFIDFAEKLVGNADKERFDVFVDDTGSGICIVNVDTNKGDSLAAARIFYRKGSDDSE